MSAQWLLPLIMIRTERDRAHTDTGPKWAKYNEPIVIGTAIVVHQASERGNNCALAHGLLATSSGH